MTDEKKDETPAEEWPNKEEVVDGVIPTAEIDQSPDLFADEDDDDLEIDFDYDEDEETDDGPE